MSWAAAGWALEVVTSGSALSAAALPSATATAAIALAGAVFFAVNFVLVSFYIAIASGRRLRELVTADLWARG